MSKSLFKKSDYDRGYNTGYITAMRKQNLPPRQLLTRQKIEFKDARKILLHHDPLLRLVV